MKFGSVFFLIISCLLGANNCDAQRNCNFEIANRSWLESEEFGSFQNDLKRQEKQQKNNKSQTVFVIPVVFHILYREGNIESNVSDAQVLSQLRVLNEDYRKLNADTTNVEAGFSKADAAIEFCLARRDPNGNETTGILRTATTTPNICATNNYKVISPIWEPKQYLNIWVCEFGENLGSARLPNNDPSDDDEDGVIVNYRFFGTEGTAEAPFNKGRTATHEVGHWFNLLHLWGFNQSCSNDDGISDTPNQGEEVYFCPSFNTSCGSKDMLSNFMGYIDDPCMGNFTEGQKSAMRTAIVSSRTSLILSNGCISVGIKENTNLTGVTLYPNPSSQRASLHWAGGLGNEKINLRLTNSSGKESQLETKRSPKGFELSYENLAPGVYFLMIETDSSQSVKKLVVGR